MIKVNGSDHQWSKGLTVTKLLEEKGYTFHLIIVRINGQLIEEEQYDATLVQDGDVVQALHIFGGG